MDKKLRNLIFSLIGLFFSAHSEAGHVEHAKMLKQHGLIDDAKRFFIEIVHSELATDADKAASLYNLGVIAFNAKQLQVAFDTWQDLIEWKVTALLSSSLTFMQKPRNGWGQS